MITELDYRSHCQILMYALPYKKPQFILIGERIAQFVVTIIPNMVKLDYTKLDTIITQRGTGGFGSTDKVEPDENKHELLSQMLHEENMK